MTSSTAPTSLPGSVRAVLDLFEGPLAEVRFPDVDRASLREVEREVEQRRAELQQALETVQAARATLEQAQAALLEQARRAHAYASVFASDDESLAAKLQQIKLDERALAPKKRGRPAKDKSDKPGKRQTSLAVADDAA